MDKLRQLNGFSAIIFDMDGLVLDTEIGYCLAWQQAAQQMGYHFSLEFGHSMSGLHQQDFSERLIQNYGAHFNFKQFTELSGYYWIQLVSKQGIPLKKGVLNLLNELKIRQFPFCLATNSSRKNALECLAFAKLEDVFHPIISCDDVIQSKPAADLFLFAAEKLNVSITGCLILEDSRVGVQAAANAKATVVFIPSVYPIDTKADSLANYTMSHLDELVEIIRD